MQVQRCASGSKLIIFEDIYEEFTKLLIDKAKSLKLGIEDDCDLGPVMNANQEKNILDSISKAKDQGAKILCGGRNI